MENTSIVIKNLNKFYGKKQVLKDVSLEIKHGEVIGYIGPNGAGKSTTVKILCGLLSDFEGEVFVNGVNIRENPVEVKSKIGYVPEMAELYEVLTPKEFFSLCGALYGISSEKSLHRAESLMDMFGMKGNMDQRMDSFSKGMKQKVLISSAILHDPDILILDEPLSGLDANSVILVKEMISKFAAMGKTIFYSSHMMDVVERVSDRIILIDNGSVIANGSIEQLREVSGQGETLESIFAKLTGSAKNNGELNMNTILG